MEQGVTERLAAVEYAQYYTNSLKSLQLREDAVLDSMEIAAPFDSDKTWLEIAKDTVSFQTI